MEGAWKIDREFEWKREVELRNETEINASVKTGRRLGKLGRVTIPVACMSAVLLTAVVIGGCADRPTEVGVNSQAIGPDNADTNVAGRANAAEKNQGVSGGIQTNSFASTTLGRQWTYNVYTPYGYDTSGLDYPVIYLLHGSGGREGSWNDGMLMLDSLINVEAIPPTIAIAPASGTSWWVDGIERFESAFVNDLLPMVDRDYHALSTREGRALAGFSMGGYGALRYGLAHSDLFGAAILLSPAVYADAPPDGSSARTSGAFEKPFSANKWTTLNYPQAAELYKSRGFDVPLFIVSGDDDWHHEEGLQYDIEQQSTLLYGTLHKEQQQPGELRILDGGHDWQVWGPGFEQGLSYVFETLGPPLPRRRSD